MSSVLILQVVQEVTHAGVPNVLMGDELCVALEVLLDLLLESLGDDGVFVQLVISPDVVQCSCSLSFHAGNRTLLHVPSLLARLRTVASSLLLVQYCLPSEYV